MMKLLLVDAYAMIYRAYYAFIRAPRINSRGENTSAIFGFAVTLDDLLKKNDPSGEPLYEWLDDNMELLSEPVYHRDMYNKIAVRMYELFLNYPDLWRVIPCLQRPSAEEYTGFKSFAKNTLRARVGNSVKHLSVLIACLTGEA